MPTVAEVCKSRRCLSALGKFKQKWCPLKEMSITDSATHSLALAVPNDNGLGVQDSVIHVQHARESKSALFMECCEMRPGTDGKSGKDS